MKFNTFVFILGFCLIPQLGRAAAPAADDASNLPYSDGWQSGDSGGFGWGSTWVLTPTGSGATFSTGNSASNGNGDTAPPIGDINTPQNASGRAWGLAANAGTTATATRSFTGILSATQTFNVDYDSGTLGSGAIAGLRLQNAAGNTLWEFDYQGGFVPYTITDGSGSGFKSANVTDQGVHIAFTLNSTTTYSVVVTPLGSSSSTSKTGSLIAATGGTDIAEFSLFFSGNAPSTTANEQYFNNISVIPEPTTLVLESIMLCIFAVARVLRAQSQALTSITKNCTALLNRGVLIDI